MRRRLRSLPLLAAVGLLLSWTGASPRADGQGVAWRLARSDLARYERTVVTGAPGAEKRTKPHVVIVHGHDLRVEGQYGPAAALIGDLTHVLALRLPAGGASTSRWTWTWTPQLAPPVRIQGEISVTDESAGAVTLAGRYTFRSRGKARRDQRWWFDDGEASTRVTFDRAAGVVRSARVEYAYEREDMKRSGADAVRKFAGTHHFELQEVVRARPKDFQARVDAAIDAGVAHLRTLQEKDGSFKPHGGYRLGTTALAILTLSACGVARDDPALARALEWMCSQTPRKTYEQAVCLMALDRAYTPQAELDLLARGHPVPERVRDMPPQRKVWALAIADALERGAASPGSWGYPAGTRSLLRFDSSNTQYAVLGLRAAQHLGHRVLDRTWLGVIRHFQIVCEPKAPKGEVALVREGEAIPDERYAHLQNRRKVASAAGFRYATLQGHDHVDAALTCAGISCIHIARHALVTGKSRKWKPKLARDVDALLTGAWAWMQRHWAMDRNALHPGGRWYYYFLYSLERAAILDDVKRVGGCDWYFEGAMQLIARQSAKEKSKGAWFHDKPTEVPPTCFALLFLKRGTARLDAPITGR